MADTKESGFFSDIFPDYRTTLLRFAVPVAAAIVLTMLAIGRAYDLVPEFLGDQTDWVMFGLGSGGVLAVAAILLCEGHCWRVPLRLAASILALCLAILLALANEAVDLHPVLFLGAVSLSAGLAPFIRVGGADEFWLFNQRLAAGLMFALVGAGLFFLGVLLIEQSIDILFSVNLGNLSFKLFMPVSFCLIAPLTWLALVPETGLENGAQSAVPDFLAVAVRTLNRFVFVPLLGIYALVLLAYAARIVVTGELPRNQIGWMVSGFGAIGAVSFLVLYGERQSERLFVRLFRRFWFAATIVPVIMLAVAIWLRVSAYGLTPDRVILILVAVWLAVIAALFAPRFGRGDIRLIPGVLALLLLATSLGPLSPNALSRGSQTARFLAVLQDAGLVQNGKLAAEFDPDSLSAEQRRRLSSSLNTLRRYGGFDGLETLFAGHPSDPFKSGNAATREGDIRDLLALDRTIDRQSVARTDITLNAGAAILFGDRSVRVLGPFSLWNVTNKVVRVDGMTIARDGEHAMLTISDDGGEVVLDFEPVISDRARAGDRRHDKRPLTVSGELPSGLKVAASFFEAYATEENGRIRLNSGRFVVVVRE